MIVPLSHVLAVAALLFAVGGVMAAARRSILFILIGVEFMLAAAGLAFAGAALAWNNLDGQAAVIIVMGLGGAPAPPHHSRLFLAPLRCALNFYCSSLAASSANRARVLAASSGSSLLRA